MKSRKNAGGRSNLLVINNMFVTMSCYYGASILDAIEPGGRSLFYGFVGSMDNVPAGEIERHCFTFFESLMSELHITKALQALRQASPDYTYICRTSEMIFDFRTLACDRRGQCNQLEALFFDGNKHNAQIMREMLNKSIKNKQATSVDVAHRHLVK